MYRLRNLYVVRKQLTSKCSRRLTCRTIPHSCFYRVRSAGVRVQLYPTAVVTHIIQLPTLLSTSITAVPAKITTGYSKSKYFEPETWPNPFYVRIILVLQSYDARRTYIRLYDMYFRIFPSIVSPSGHVEHRRSVRFRHVTWLVRQA